MSVCVCEFFLCLCGAVVGGSLLMLVVSLHLSSLQEEELSFHVQDLLRAVDVADEDGFIEVGHTDTDTDTQTHTDTHAHREWQLLSSNRFLPPSFRPSFTPFCPFLPLSFQLQCDHITTGRRGFVPGNFVTPVPESELAAQEELGSPTSKSAAGSTTSSKKKGFFKVFSKRS